jgi:hypothetical protein
LVKIRVFLKIPIKIVEKSRYIRIFAMKIPIKARGGARTEKLAPRLDRANGYADRGIDQCSINIAS